MIPANIFSGILLVLLLAGCAAQQAYRKGQNLYDAGRVEEGLAQMGEAYKLEPGNSEYRSQYFRKREIAIFQWLNQAEAAKKNAAWDEAENYYQRILKIDPDNPRAKAGLSKLTTEKKHAQLLHEARAQLDKGNLAEAAKTVRPILAESPSHPGALELRKAIDAKLDLANQTVSGIKPKLDRPITIEFKDAPIRAVFELISKTAGINIIFDKEVRPELRANLFVRDARIEDVIRFILVTNQLEQRVLNENTLFIYPNTPQKQKDFQELQIRHFYLTNANAKEVAAMLKGMVKTNYLNVDDKLNLITMRDTAEAIQVAERMIAAYDIAEPEVMLEVEVLEVGTNLLDTIGIQYPTQISYSAVGAAGEPGVLTLPEFRKGGTGLVQVAITDPALVVNLLHQDGDSNILANPRIRVKNREKANIHIGDKLPVITSNATSTGLVSQSITYLDAGLKLDVEPTVHLDNEVGIKVGLEVSSISKQIQNKDGSLTYQIGTRTASTTLRLKDGETQILAGLISKEDRKAANSIPGLGQLPIIGRLFSNRTDSASRTEVVLLITPRIVRNIVLPESPIEAFSSGTENAIGLDKMEIKRAEIATNEKGDEPESTSAIPETMTAKLAEDGPTAKSGNFEVLGVLALQPGSVQMVLDAPRQAQTNSTFVARINLVAEGLQNAMLDISFDPGKLKVIDVTEGELLKKPDGKSQFMRQIQDKMGRINLSVVRQGNMKGEGTLASITFQTLATGSSQLRIGAANFSDAAGKILPFNALPAATVEIIR